MLAYQTKTYEHFFWKFYKEAFKQAVKGFFRADEHRKGEFLNYFKYLHAYRTNYSCDVRKNTKWGDFVVTWVKTHTLSVWTTGLVFHYHQEEPMPASNAGEGKKPFLNEDEQQALQAYVTAYTSAPFEGQEMDRHISAYEACANDRQRSWMLAFCRWFHNAPADLYDELSLLD